MALELFEIHGELEQDTALKKSICEECVMGDRDSQLNIQ